MIYWPLCDRRSDISQYSKTKTASINDNSFSSKNQQNSEIYRTSQGTESRRTKTNRDGWRRRVRSRENPQKKNSTRICEVFG